MQFDNILFAREWFSLLQEKEPQGANPIMVEISKFFSAFVAFNCLYTPLRECTTDDSKRIPETTAIKMLIEQELEKPRKNKRRFSLSQAYSKIPHSEKEITKGVSRYDVSFGEWTEEICDSTLKSVEKVFLRIYAVRCNLFHGMKLPYSDERDRKLVIESRYILEAFLEWCLDLDDSQTGGSK
jgi:hypothetical protein